ncbi:MAG: OmpA family protein [Pseudomonadota bacterium]
MKKLTKETAIYFGLGNKNISDQGKDDIKRLAAEVDNCPDVRIEIAGHSDSLGLDGINFELSWQRAEAVNDLIKGLGYDNSSYITVGYGARRPAKKIKIPAIVKTVFVVKKEEAQSTKEQTENTENTEPKSEELALQKEKSERRRKLRLEYIRRNSVNRRVEFNLR